MVVSGGGAAVAVSAGVAPTDAGGEISFALGGGAIVSAACGGGADGVSAVGVGRASSVVEDGDAKAVGGVTSRSLDAT